MGATVDTSTPAPLTAVQRLIYAALPWLAYVGTRSYVIRKDNGDGSWSLAPAPGPFAAKLEPLPSVPTAWFQGLSFAPSIGSVCAVVFLDHDVTQPRVVHCAPATPSNLAIDSTGAMAIGAHATSVAIAGGGPAIGRVGDKTGQLLFDNVSPSAELYYRTHDGDPWVAVAGNPSAPSPPAPTDPGTDTFVTTGSAKVESG